MTHNVFFWLKENIANNKFEEEATKLLSIDVVQNGSLRKLASTPERPVTDKTFTYHLCLEFTSIDNHNAYQCHESHHYFVNECNDMWDRVVVYDSEEI
tara:strand:- start:115 stop:408 length:294 start_codon:yes stop_codon:yes gene_type:complete